jgi:glycerol-3-phosphate acyltransferase PlsY
VSVAVLLVTAGYLAGSMPFGYWIVRLLRGEDIRLHGSGNIGGTNVWRTFGARLGVPVILLDLLKGLIPALIASLTQGALVAVLAGAAAMLGHWRPLFLRFRRGGKMVATCGGAVIGIAPLVAAVGVVVWAVVFVTGRYASLARTAAARDHLHGRGRPGHHLASSHQHRPSRTRPGASVPTLAQVPADVYGPGLGERLQPGCRLTL